jgi:lipopolysaccharide/colanic/teichoic acid biosynthesis glycosyltransferase
MSLVGPRPPLAYEVEHYEPWQFERLAVRPGITGLWQVSGRNRLTHARMCELDIEYIHTWTVARDLMIILKTPWVMLVNGGGAE